MFTQNFGQGNINKVRERQGGTSGNNIDTNNERLKKAQEIIEKFPVTNDMFPQANVRPMWIVCK